MESKIVSKIQKLLALSTSSNQHEAINALTRANALMQEYDITDADIKDNELSDAYGSITNVEGGEITSQSKYKYLLFTGISKLFKVSVISKPVNPHRCKVSLIGRQHRIEIAIHTYEYLVDSISRITPRELKGDDKKKFQIGAAVNICERIHSMLIENTIDNPSTNSIVLANYQLEINNFLADKFPGIINKSINMKKGNQAGYDAANDISLNSHLNSTPSSDKLALLSQK